MTEKEKLALAKKYIDYLARGFNPLNNEPVDNNDIVRNERISRCFMYVSEVLGQVIEKGIAEDRSFSYKKAEKAKKQEFYISYEDRKKFVFSDEPLTSTEIAVALSSLIDTEKYKDLKGVAINEWLAGRGFLKETVDYYGKKRYVNSDEGIKIGITSEQRLSKYNTTYQIVKFTKSAQEFIIDNLDGVIEHNNIRKEIQKAEKIGNSYKKNKFSNLMEEVIYDLYCAGATAEEIASTTDSDINIIISNMKKMNLI